MPHGYPGQGGHNPRPPTGTWEAHEPWIVANIEKQTKLMAGCQQKAFEHAQLLANSSHPTAPTFNVHQWTAALWPALYRAALSYQEDRQDQPERYPVDDNYTGLDDAFALLPKVTDEVLRTASDPNFPVAEFNDGRYLSEAIASLLVETQSRLAGFRRGMCYDSGVCYRRL